MIPGAASGGEPAPLRVTDFGATPDDRRDDAPAVQRAVDALPPGGTLLFPKGRYRIATTVALRGDAAYVGEPGAELVWAGRGADYLFRATDPQGLRIAGLTFTGRGVMIDGGHGRDVTVAGCVFQDIWKGDALFFPHRLKGAVVRDNRFQRIGASDRRTVDSTGLRAYDPDGLTIAGNRFDTVFQGVSIHWEALGGRDILIAGNSGRRVHRMGIETLGDPEVTGLIVRGNEFREFLRPWGGSFGLSIVVDGSRGTRVEDNRVSADAPPIPGERYGYGIEASGQGVVVAGNRVDGTWAASIALGEVRDAVVERNRICGNGASAAILNYLDRPAIIGANPVEPGCPPPAD